MNSSQWPKMHLKKVQHNVAKVELYEAEKKKWMDQNPGYTRAQLNWACDEIMKWIVTGKE